MAVAGYTLIKLYRGTTENIQQALPEKSEPLFDLDKNKLYLGDGKTHGGRYIGPFEPGILGFHKIMTSTNMDAHRWQMINTKTDGGIVELILPVDPVIGDQIRIVDGSKSFNTNVCSLLRNGYRINGLESNLDLSDPGQYILYYGNDGTNDTWFVFKVVGEKWFDQGIERDNWNVIEKSAAYTAMNNDSILCDTTGGAFIITTPATPELGDIFQVQDWKNNFSSGNLTITPNGSQTIASFASDLILAVDDQIVSLMYDIDSAGDFTWKVKYGRDNNDIIDQVRDAKNSIEIDSGDLQLVGDQTNPGNNKYYGTNGSGVKGFHDNTSPSKNSIETDSGNLQLVGDQLTPGNDKFYGTNGSGVKGFYNLPVSSEIKTVFNSDANANITDSQSGIIITNSGATGPVTFSLDPANSDGAIFIFSKAEGDQDLTISVPAGVYIGDSTSGGQISNTTLGQAGSSITIVKISSVMYSILGGWGSWTTS